MIMQRFTVLSVMLSALLLPFSAQAQFDHQHQAWTELLKKHVVVSDGGAASQMRYAALVADSDALKAYLSALSKIRQDEFSGWSREQQLAFLINAYNAHMLGLILTRYPNIKSVWDFGKIFNNPFKQRFIRLLGRDMHLDDIEHGMIRADGVYDDPRIHFAVNCAAVGCPMLREEAYVADRLELQLENQTVRFLSDRSRNRFNPASRVLEVSKIFDAAPWYGGDFRRGWKGYRSLESFFATYANLLADNPDDQKLLRDRQAKIRHLDYDWGLNDVKR